MPEYAVDLQIYCSVCGAGICHGTSIKGADVKVSPCQRCLDEATEEGEETGEATGYKDGYAEGLLDGARDGESTGYDAGYEAGFVAGVESMNADVNDLKRTIRELRDTIGGLHAEIYTLKLQESR